eukprot:5243782-Karenia_brevis.AAC.1
MPANYTNVLLTNPTPSRPLTSFTTMGQEGAIQRLGKYVNMDRAQWVDKLPDGRSIADYMLADTIFRYDYHLDKPHLDHRKRDMRQIRGYSLFPGSYDDC